MFTSRDILAIASFSVMAGLIFAATSHLLAPIAFALGGHLGVGAIYGLWFIGGTLTGYVVRKPWAAFLGETIGALIELLLISPYTVLLLYYGPAQGIMTEAAFALGRYKRWGAGTMALAGVLPVVLAYPFDCLVSPFYPACRWPGYPIWLHAAIVAAMAASGALLGGVLVKLAIDGSVRAGALKGWPVAEGKRAGR